MSAITPTAEELKAQCFTPETLFGAVNSFHRDGFLVLEGVEDPKLLTDMNAFLLTEGEEVQASSHIAEQGHPTSQYIHLDRRGS